jgi:hypothetical protein
MANEVLIKNGTPIVWAFADEYGNLPWADTYGLDLGGLANAAARQGVKGDLGATRAAQYAVRVGIELDVDLSAAGQVDVYWSTSPSGTAATSNTGGATGADAAYTDGVDSHKEHLEYIGTLYLPATADDDILYDGIIGVFSPKDRYGMPVVINRSGQALEADADTMYVALIPLVDEIQ